MVKEKTEKQQSTKHPTITKEHSPKHLQSPIQKKMIQKKPPKHIQSTRHTPPPRHPPTRQGGSVKK